MSDVYCTTCGEPWDTHHLLHDEIADVIHDAFPFETAERLLKRWRAKRPKLTHKLPLSGAALLSTAALVDEVTAPTWERLFERRGWRFIGHTLLAVARCPACPSDAKADPEAEKNIAEYVQLAAGDEDALSVELGAVQLAFSRRRGDDAREALEASGIPVVRAEHPHVIAEDHGSVWLFTCYGDARAWWDEHVAESPRLGDAHAVEHRFAIDLIRGLKDEGFRVEVK